jgi:hypothetical protein
MASGCPYQGDFALAHAQLIDAAAGSQNGKSEWSYSTLLIAVPSLRRFGLAEVAAVHGYNVSVCPL